MIQASDFISACMLHGYTFFTGVPCSFLKPLINYTIQDSNVDYVAASSEGEAVGIAAGAYLAGRKAVVMCQNSGLGNMINPLTSLNFPFRIPVLLIITLRGEASLNDEPQHELMGQITPEILDTLRIPWEFFPDTVEEVGAFFERAEKEILKTQQPFALVMKKGSVGGDDVCHGLMDDQQFLIDSTLRVKIGGEFQCKIKDRMSRFESIKVIREILDADDAIIATTGKIGRELFTLGDVESQMYVVGSMGCAAGLGFGIQRIKPNQRVVVLDGDGAILMKMGTLATIGHNESAQLVHIVLDNEAYESTGGQLSVSSTVDFCHIAAACGYQQCFRADTKKDLIQAICGVRDKQGPSLIHVKVACGSDSNLGRPTLKPFQVKDRFMKYLARNRNDV